MRRALGLLLVISALHLAAQLAGSSALADTTQVLLMPVVAGVLWTSTESPRERLVRLALLALFFSWLGDSAPRLTSGDTSFLLMVGFFLLAQLVYVVALWPYRYTSLLRRPLAVLPYVVAALGIIVLCAPRAGVLLPAVAVYAIAIVMMAVLATGLGRLAGIGAVVFVVSDALIALRAFGVLAVPGHDFWVMSTYIAAQTMLVLAIRRRARDGPAPQEA